MAHTPGIYGSIARFVLHHRRMVGLVTVLTVLLSALIGIPPEVDPNLLNLLPADEPAVAAIQKLQAEEGGISLVTLAYRSDDPELLERTLQATARDLEALDRVDYALHSIDPDLGRQLGLLQLEASEVQTLNGRLKGALALGPALNPMVLQPLMAMGPLTQRIEELANTPTLFGSASGTGRILVRPTGTSLDQAFALAVMDDIDAVLATHETPGVVLTWKGGAYRHVVEDLRGIKSDLGWTTFTSLGLVLLLTLVAFRSLRSTLLVFVPLLAANVVVLALVRLSVGSLNSYTSFGTAILIGLGIDFAVHLVGRYREYRERDFDIDESIERAWDRTGPPCMTAALTSAAGFLALAAADFQGFAQLGILLAVGLMVCLFAMLVLLPALIPTLDREAPPLLGITLEPGPESTSTYKLAPLGLIAAIMVTLAVGVNVLPTLQWEYDISALRQEGMAWAELSEEQRTLVKDAYSPMFVEVSSPAERIRVQALVDAAITDGRLPHVARTVSIDTVLPPDQEARVAALQELVRLVDHENLRYLPPPLTKPLLPLMGQTMVVREPGDLPRPVQDLLGLKAGLGPRLLLLPTGNMWDLRETAALEQELNAVLAEGAVAGEYVTLGALYRTLQRDMPIVAGLAGLLVVLLTWWDLRRPMWVVAAMGTLCAGLIWAGWLTSLVEVRLSMINVVGVPILVGIGVDVVIHLLHRLRDEGPGGVRRALRTTGVAASISTLTTIASFASLSMAGNRGVQSLGLLVVFGLVGVFVATCGMLPLMWAAGWRVTGRAPGDPRTPRSPRRLFRP